MPGYTAHIRAGTMQLIVHFLQSIWFHALPCLTIPPVQYQGNEPDEQEKKKHET